MIINKSIPSNDNFIGFTRVKLNDTETPQPFPFDLMMILTLFSFYIEIALEWTREVFCDGLEIELTHFKISSTDFLSRSAYYRNDRYKRNHQGDSSCQNSMIFNTICFLFCTAVDIKFIFSS